MNIAVTVSNKIASVAGAPAIVCGNSDYTVQFTFDSEWSAYPEKTAYFVYCVNGARRYRDVQFTGNTVAVPVLYNTYEVEIGVCAGDIRTTTGARMQCVHCITDGAPQHEPPAQDVYKEIIERLEKLEQEGGGGGGSRLSGHQTVLLNAGAEVSTGVMRWMTQNRWEYAQENNDNAKTAATLTVRLGDDCLLLAAVMHRGSVAIEGDGWEQIAVSGTAVSDKIEQWITVWAKRVSGGRHTVTVTQDPNTSMSLKVIALYQARSVSVAENTLIDRFPFQPLPTTGKRRLYLLSAIYAVGSVDSVEAQDTGDLELQTAGEQRFSVFYDWQPERGVTPSFSYSTFYTANTANALTLDIEEDTP